MPDAEPTRSGPRRHLSLFDSVSIIVGIIIGAGIYETTPLIASNAGGPWMLMGLWLLGGLASLIGALCYAELATAIPREGGDYVFVTRAYGRGTGFLLGWCWFWVVWPGSIGAMAFVFARYADQVAPLVAGVWGIPLYAAVSVLVLTGLNVMGLRGGPRTQNVLTLAKVAGMGAIIVVGMVSSGRSDPPPENVERGSDFALAMIFVLFVYGGWSDISYVASEVREPSKNLLRSLVLGVAAVTLIYLLINVAFLAALGFDGVAASGAVAVDVVAVKLGGAGSALIAALVCVSALGAINGLLLTGGRVYYAIGRDHRAFEWLGRWDERRGTPLRSLVVLGMMSVALIAIVGTENGFERLVIFTAPIFWFFAMLVAVSVIVLRVREPGLTRPFRVPAYPLTPLLFAGTCGFMLYSSTMYAWENPGPEAWWTLTVVLCGCGVALFSRSARRKGQTSELPR